MMTEIRIRRLNSQNIVIEKRKQGHVTWRIFGYYGDVLSLSRGLLDAVLTEHMPSPDSDLKEQIEALRVAIDEAIIRIEHIVS